MTNPPVKLNKLKEEIASLGETIKSLKAADEVDKDAVAAAVEKLLAAKKLYADNNDGIGVDGKPFGGKKEKKSGGGGPSKQQSDPNSANAQKKAAKKAAKAAKKAAKKGGGESIESGTPAVSSDSKQNAPVKPVTTKGPEPVPVAAVKFSASLQPLQVAINPNAPLTERPVVTLAVAVLSNTALDLDLISDHRSPRTAMGLEDGSAVVTGDFAMARYLARRARATTLLPEEPASAAVMDAWIDYAQSLTLLDQEQRLRAVTLTLEHALAEDGTYLVGQHITLADLCLFSAAGFPTQVTDLANIKGQVPAAATGARRWLGLLAQHPALQEATQLCVGIANNAEAALPGSQLLDPLVPGMNALQGALPGKVVTRFPPEPSGYLHIGHAKACLLNDYYARRYQGRLILRFDDTNPSKEKEEFQDSIVEDLAKLGVKPDLVTYTSDYFEAFAGYAKQLIESGLAYMDDTPQEQVKTERADRIDSKHRNQSTEDTLKFFQLMCSGCGEGAVWCLRAKIDMKSDNGAMRDPVLYRQNLTPHHRTGTKYKAYPTYDLTCPIIDSLEGVTHACRTTEYNDRDEQYQWVLKALGLRRVRNSNFSRVNFVNTVLSKRKLTWFVDNGYVTGWDDARFPTVRGVVRRGINITALSNFMYSQGASKRVVNMDWSTFWAENKKEIDKKAKRFMAIDCQNHARLVITNAPKKEEFGFVETTFHPKDPSLGKRVVRIADQVLLETVDVEGIELGEEIVLVRWGVISIKKVDGTDLEGEFIPEGDFKTAKRKLSWIADVSNNTPVVLTEFDNLISKEKLEENDNFEDFINPNTLATTEVIGDAGLKTLQEHDVIQLERRGFYRVDRPYVNQEKPLVLYMIPDGKAKAMSGQTGKLAHR